MGLSVRDDPPKVVDLSIREFGEPVDGLALSILQIPREDRDALASVSVVIRNIGQVRKPLTIPGWLAFYRLDIQASLTPFGRALTNPERSNERLNVSLEPGTVNETEIPIGSIFALKPGASYQLTASCQPTPDQTLTSNKITVR